MAIPRFSRDVAPAAVVDALKEQGCAVVERLIDASMTARVLDELAPFIEATAPGTDDFAGHNTRRTGGLIARSAACRELVLHPVVREVVGGLLADATSYQLHLTQMIAIGPGEGGQQIHRDQWAFDFFPFPRGYEVQCNTIWAMCDFTDANGATRIIPGSNKREDRLQFGYEDTEPAEMPAGSVLLYTGSVYHGGGANRSQSVRYGLNITYARSWLRQEENQYLAVPHDIARTLPDDLLRLMGYQRGAYALGYVDDLRDPLDVLKGPGHGMDTRLGDLGNARDLLRRPG
ncbi:MAG TPA: phytanoyl-CoA dioxygenase family protein [Candidatus Limnocylindrales bacterium]|nr:phytanoyl-CoA dioxygenase family protein [Candidatus Limnocylindrales bacterium]